MSCIYHARAGLLAAVLLASAAAPASADLMLKFVNTNLNYNASNVYVTFGGASTGFSGTINGGGALVLGQSYSLDQLGPGVTLNEFASGRIFVSLGAKLTSASAGTGYAPNFANPSLPDYGTRWDKVEVNYKDGAGGANLTSQDFFSVPLQITTSGGGVAPANLGWRASTAPVMEALGKLSNFSLAEPPGGGFSPFAAIVTGSGGVTIPGVSQPVVRIISPGTVTGKTDGTTVYPSLAPYLSDIRTNAVATTIAGSNATAANPRQTYDFTATIANAASTLGGSSVSPGDLVLSGTVNDGSGPDVPTIAIVKAADLTDSKIYGAAVPFTVTEGADTNGVVTHAIADYLSALNFGLVGSDQPNPNDPGHTIGESPSWTWYGNNPDGSASAKLPIGDAFANAQPVNPFYNPYAAYLVGVTDSYGFPYNDRLQLPLASLGNGTLLTITVLPDALPGSGTPVPEPATLPLLAVALLMLAGIRLAVARSPSARGSRPM